MKTRRPILTLTLLALTSALMAPLAPAQPGAQGGEDLPPAPRGGAGNTHPESHLLEGQDANALLNPFGLPSNAPAGDAVAKREFAKKLDLAPLRDLAVQHDGRVKILDTLARETVRAITGRKDFIDILPPKAGDDAAQTWKPDPVFTLLDMVIDPAYYADKPLIHVQYLPLRQALLEHAFPGDEQTQQLWNTRTRLSPSIIDANATPVFNQYGDSGPFRDALNRVESMRRLYLLSASNLLMVAPESRDKEWGRLTELPADSGPRKAAAELGEAWRALDADRANAAIKSLAAELPAIHPDIYPDARRDLELAYNRSNAFAWGAWVYLLSLLMLVLAFGTGRKWLVIGGVSTLMLAVALHAFGFSARCIIAERFAIQNQFESMTGVSLFAAVVGLVIMVWRRQWLFGAAAAGAGFLILTGATQMNIPGVDIGREAAILNTSVLLKYHVTTVLTSYGLITLGMITSLFYLGAHYGTKWFGKSEAQLVASASLSPPGRGQGEGSPSSLASSFPTNARLLADLDKAQLVILQLAFWALGVGILLGAWWADHSWGRWWAFDPKETWALVTWIIYLIVIHVRVAIGGEKRGFVTAWLSVLGFIVMLWTYFGVNLLLPGLHAYA